MGEVTFPMDYFLGSRSRGFAPEELPRAEHLSQGEEGCQLFSPQSDITYDGHSGREKARRSYSSIISPEHAQHSQSRPGNKDPTTPPTEKTHLPLSKQSGPNVLVKGKDPKQQRDRTDFEPEE